MTLIRRYSVFVLFFGLHLGSVFGQLLNTPRRGGNGLTDQEYIYAFTEATKYYLFGNYVQAVGLYNECLKLKPESGAVHFQLSKIFLNTGNTSLAREHAKKAYLFDKKNKWYSQQLADIFQIEEKFDSAAFIYESLLVLDPQNLNLMLGIVSLYEKTGKYSEALGYLDLIDAKAGLSREVSLNRYRILEKTGETSKALEQLKIALKLSGNNYVITGMMAEFYRKHNMVDSAKNYYQKISQENFVDPMLILSYADFMLEIGELDSARSMIIAVIKNDKVEDATKAGFFMRVLRDGVEFGKVKAIIDTISTIYYQYNNTDIRALSVYADVQLRLQKYKSASNALRSIVDQDASNYPAVEQLIYTLNILGKSDSVILYSDRAIQRFKESAVLYLFNGSARFQKKEYERALLVLEKGLSLSKEDGLKIEFYSLIAECNQSLERYIQSEAAFLKALEIDNKNLLIRNNFAYYLALREKDLKMARKLSKETIKAEPRNSTYLDTYGWILFKMGKIRAAWKIIEMALFFEGGNNIEILSHAAEIMIELKEYQEAIKLFEKILAISEGQKAEEIKLKIADIEKRL
jgi:tetratricopeptide (TPR) repeat protein